MTNTHLHDIAVKGPLSTPSDSICEPILRTYSRKHRSCQQEREWQCTESPCSDRNPNSSALAFIPTKRYLPQQNPPPQKLKKRSFTQLHLDAGQANFACTTCSVCGLIYAKGEANDEKVHATFHAKYTVGIKFQGWQHERIVKWDARQGRVLLVLQSDPAVHLNKVRELCSLVEDHLGLCKGWLLSTLCQITSASPVVPTLDDCATSSAIQSGPLHTDPPITPRSAPPFSKHKRLSSQPNTHASSSTMPASQSAFAGCCAGLRLNTLERPASHCHTQQHVSVGSSQTTLFASPGLLGSQPAKKQPKQNMLTKWLATSQHKAAAAPSLHPDSPLSAGSAASRQEDEGLQGAVDSKPAQSDVGGPIPMAPLADVTNRLPASIASEKSSMTQEPPCTMDSLHSSFSVGAAVSAALTEQRHQQQPPAQAVLHSVNQQTGQQQECPPVHADEHSAGGQQPPACTGLLLGSCNGKHVEAGSALVSAGPQPEQDWMLPAEGQQQMLKRLQNAVVRVDREHTVKAACGIKVMWVSAQARRKGIATLLLDTARCNCIAGYVVPRSQLAFTQPTQAGRQLAEHYTQSRSFLVY